MENPLLDRNDFRNGVFSYIILVLLGIEAGKINPEECAVVIIDHNDNSNMENYHDFNKYRGKFLKYRDQIYTIPK